MDNLVSTEMSLKQRKERCMISIRKEKRRRMLRKKRLVVMNGTDLPKKLTISDVEKYTRILRLLTDFPHNAENSKKVEQDFSDLADWTELNYEIEELPFTLKEWQTHLICCRYLSPDIYPSDKLLRAVMQILIFMIDGTI